MNVAGQGAAGTGGTGVTAPGAGGRAREAIFLWWREVRFVLGLPHLILPVALALFLALGGAGSAGLTPRQVAKWAEMIAPLLGILLASDIVTRDAALGVIELSSTRGRGAAGLFARRFTIEVLYLASLVAGLIGAAAAGLPGPSIMRTMASAFTGAVFFGALAATAAHRFGGSMTGASLTAALWGALTISAVVFPQSSAFWRAVGPFPAMVGVQGVTFLVNRAAYLGVMLILFLLNLRLLAHPERLLGRE